MVLSTNPLQNRYPGSEENKDRCILLVEQLKIGWPGTNVSPAHTFVCFTFVLESLGVFQHKVLITVHQVDAYTFCLEFNDQNIINNLDL